MAMAMGLILLAFGMVNTFLLYLSLINSSVKRDMVSNRQSHDILSSIQLQPSQESRNPSDVKHLQYLGTTFHKFIFFIVEYTQFVAIITLLSFTVTFVMYLSGTTIIVCYLCGILTFIQSMLFLYLSYQSFNNSYLQNANSSSNVLSYISNIKEILNGSLEVLSPELEDDPIVSFENVFTEEDFLFESAEDVGLEVELEDTEMGSVWKDVEDESLSSLQCIRGNDVDDDSHPVVTGIEETTGIDAMDSLIKVDQADLNNNNNSYNNDVVIEDNNVSYDNYPEINSKNHSVDFQVQPQNIHFALLLLPLCSNNIYNMAMYSIATVHILAPLSNSLIISVRYSIYCAQTAMDFFHLFELGTVVAFVYSASGSFYFAVRGIAFCIDINTIILSDINT